MKKGMIEIEVGRNVNFDNRWDVSIDDFIDLLQERKKDGATHMDVWCNIEDGFNVDFNKYRLETEVEEEIRTNEEARRKQVTKDIKRELERQEYEKLKKKFEDN